MKPAA
jgi:hypothetical protein